MSKPLLTHCSAHCLLSSILWLFFVNPLPSLSFSTSFFNPHLYYFPSIHPVVLLSCKRAIFFFFFIFRAILSSFFLFFFFFIPLVFLSSLCCCFWSCSLPPLFCFLYFASAPQSLSSNTMKTMWATEGGSSLISFFFFLLTSGPVGIADGRVRCQRVWRHSH